MKDEGPNFRRSSLVLRLSSKALGVLEPTPFKYAFPQPSGKLPNRIQSAGSSFPAGDLAFREPQMAFLIYEEENHAGKQISGDVGYRR
jgi:hypothetical protein